MSATSGPASFVIFPLGDRLFALRSCDVVELSRAGVVQKFPHTTPGISGVLIRRGEALPVWNLTEVLPGPGRVPRKLWLIARVNFAGEERTAIPVSGECQMTHAVMLPAAEGSPLHIRGVLPLGDRLIQVIDLSALTGAPLGAPHRDGSQERPNEERQ